MKRFLSMAIAAALMLSGCMGQGQRIREPVTFYYLRSQYEYGSSKSIIGMEEREASGHRGDLRYLMALYLMGPSEEDLRSPLPSGTKMLSVEKADATVTLTLSELPAAMTDTAFSLACACLTKTCLGLTDAESVTIVSGSRNLTMTLDKLIFLDSTEPNETEETS